MKPVVLYVAPEIPLPHAGSFLGGSTHVAEVSTSLIRNGFSVYVLCRRNSREQPAFEKLGEDLFVYRAYRGLIFPVGGTISKKATKGRTSLKARLSKLAEKIYFATLYRAVMALFAARIIRKHHCAVVLERNSGKGIGAFSAKLLGIPLVEEVIDPDYSPIALRMADRVFAYTPKVLNGLVPEDRVIITSAGVDAGLFHPTDGTEARKRMGILEKKVAVYVGAASAWHGIEVLVRAAEHLSDDYRILLIGQSSVEIERMAREKNVSHRLVFTGFVEHKAVPVYIAAADVAVAPYDPSGLPEMEKYGFYFSPIKLFEYMACARPVVATDIDIVRDIIRSSGCGLIVPPGEPQTLAKAIMTIAEAPDKGKAMGEAGRKACIEHYTWEAVGGGIAAALRSLLKK